MSKKTEQETGNDDEAKEVKLNLDPLDETHEKVIVNTILILGLIGIALFIIGIVWSIKDIFSQNFWEWFTDEERAIQTQLFIIGLILIGLFFLLIFLYVLYKRGIRSFAGTLFKEKPEKELRKEEEYLPAKIITIFGLLSVFSIVVGLIIASIQTLIGTSNPQTGIDFIDVIFILSGGVRILILSVALILIDGLIYGFAYIWLNGQWVVVNKILLINQKVKEKYDITKTQKIIAQIIFGIFVIEISAVFIGIIWAIVDAIAGDFSEDFANFVFGIKFSFFGIFGSLLFVILVGAMFIYKRGLNLIIVPLFIQKQPDQEKSNTMAVIITIGFLFGLGLIFLGLIIWIVSLIVTGISFGELSGGFALFTYGLIAFIVTCLGLVFSFALHNGYTFVMDKILKIEVAIDESLEEVSKKAKGIKNEPTQ